MTLYLKLKHIYGPFLLLGLVVIYGYGGLRWLLDIKLSVLSIHQDVLDLFIPFALVVACVLLVMRHRLRLLWFADEQLRIIYLVVMGIVLLWPAFVLQRYISTAAYPLVEVNRVEQLADYPADKYFRLSDYRIADTNPRLHSSFRRTGDNDNRLMMRLYLALPLETTAAGDSVPAVGRFWYGVSYYREISNALSDVDKELAYRAFLADSLVRFAEHEFYHGRYFERLKASERLSGFHKALPETAVAPVVLVPRYDRFETRADDEVRWFFYSYFGGALVLLLMVVGPPINHQALKHFLARRPLPEDALGRLLASFNLWGARPATAVLLNLNLLVFIGCVVAGANPVWPTAQELLPLGAVRRDLVLDGEVWRVMTATLVHAGFLHLIVNLLVLGFAGHQLETVLGGRRMLWLYCLSGIAGSLTSVLWYDSVTSVGASGAIFGVVGALAVLAGRGLIAEDNRVLVWLLAVVVIGSGLLMAGATNVDNAAHCGGLIGGILLAHWLSRRPLIS